MSPLQADHRFGRARQDPLLTRYHWIVLVVCLVNLVFFLWLRPFTASGVQLLDNADFVRGLSGWTLNGDGSLLETGAGKLAIDHHATHSSTEVSQCRSADSLPETLILSAEVMSQAVVPGVKPWHEARIDLVGYDSQGEGDYQVKTRLVSLSGDRSWRSYSGIFHKHTSAQTLCVEVSLYAASGRFAVTHLSLYRGVENPSYLFGSRLLLSGWVLLGLWLAKALFDYYRQRVQGRYLLLLLPLLLTGILMPHETRLMIEQQLLPLLSHIGIHLESSEGFSTPGGWALWPQQWDLSKISHLIGFMLMGVILFSEQGVSLGRCFAGLLLLAVATELMQFFVPERTPRLSDVIVDGFGSCLGFAVGAAIRRLGRHQPSTPAS